MDIEHINHGKAKMTMLIAVVLSAMVVTIAAFLGRGVLHIKSALTLEREPDEVTVVVLERQRDPEATVTNVEPIPHREGDDSYGFLYEKNSEEYLVRVVKKNQVWAFQGEPEPLHAAEPSDDATTGAQNQ